jgi:hypothetical protein
MISVRVYLIGRLRKYLPDGPNQDYLDVSLEENASLEYLVKDKIGLSREIYRIILINNLLAREQQILRNCDVIKIYPAPVAGG